MGTSYTVHEDKVIRIEVDEMSTQYAMTIEVKSGGQFPAMVIELFVNEPIEAKTLGEMGCKILCAAFLQMDDKDIKEMKDRVGRF